MKLFLSLSFLLASAWGKITVGVGTNSYTAYTSATNTLQFEWTAGDIQYGELIGVFASGTTCTKAGTADQGIYPHLEIMPSKSLSNTNNKLLVAQSPQTTSSFGSLTTVSGKNTYRLCYCNWDPVKAICNYEQDVGALNVIDLVPRHFASTGAINSVFFLSLTAGPLFKFTVGAKTDRVMAIPRKLMCGKDAMAADWGTAKTTLTSNSLTPTQDFDANGNTWTQEAKLTVAVPENMYILCLCVGTTCLQSANGVAGSSSLFNYEVGSIFIHDLTFSDLTTVKAVSKSASGSSIVGVTFTYSKPSTVLASDGTDGRNQFWFSSAKDCGDGSHTQATASSTAVYPMPGSHYIGQVETSVDVSSLMAGTDLYRMCFAKRSQLGLAPTGLYDLTNVGLRVSDLSISAPLALRAANQAVTMTWTSSLSPGDQVFFAQGGACQSQANPVVASGTSSDTVTVSFSGVYWFDFSSITQSSDRALFSLCVLPVGQTGKALRYDSGLWLAPSDVLVSVPKHGNAANEAKANVVSNAAGQDITLDTDQAKAWDNGKDILWFRDSSKPCGDLNLGDVADDASIPLQLATDLVTTSGTGLTFSFDFSQVKGVTTNKLFRLCVKDAGSLSTGKTGTGQVYDYASAAVMVTPAYTASPTAFQYPAQPTPLPATSVTSIPLQVWERGAYEELTSSNLWPGLTWTFSGTTTTGDLLGFLPVASSVDNAPQTWSDCGQSGYSTSSTFWTLASHTGTPAAGQVLSGDLPGSMPAGRYLVCYCNTGWVGNTAQVPPRDCGLSENWDMMVGFVTINKAKVDRNRVAQSPSTATGQALWSLWIPGADVTNDKFALVPAGKPCGTPFDSTGAYIPATVLTFDAASSVSNVAGGADEKGIDVAALVPTAGHYDLCYCRAAGENGGTCPTADYNFGSSNSKAGKFIWSYGAKVGSVTSHDMKMVHGVDSLVKTSRMSVPKTSNAKIKFSYTTVDSRANGRPVWFARTDTACVFGPANSNATNAVSLPPSGSEATFDFASLSGPVSNINGDQCAEQWRLCTQLSDGTVAEYPDIRIVPSDAIIAMNGQKAGGVASTKGTTLSHTNGALSSVKLHSGCQLVLGAETRFWFMQADKPCSGITSAKLTPANGAVDENSQYLKTLEPAGGKIWVDGDFAATMSTPTKRIQYRLCACQNCGTHAAAAPASTPTRNYDKAYVQQQFWDFPELQIYLVPATANLLDVGHVKAVAVSAGKPTILTADAASADVSIGFGSAGVGSATANLESLKSGDVVWFRNIKSGCGTGAADEAQGGLTTATPEVTYSGTFAVGQSSAASNTVSFNFRQLTQADQNFRLCIRSATPKLVLDVQSAHVLVAAAAAAPTAKSELTKKPTYAAPPTEAAGGKPDFVEDEVLTITPGTDSATSRTFEFKPVTKTAGRKISKGDRLAFVRVADTGLHSTGCANFKTGAFFETIFTATQTTQAATALTAFKLPRFPVGMYYACYCSFGLTCGDGNTVWSASVGIVQVVDADIQQTVTSTTEEMFRTTATALQGNIRLAVNYFSGIPIKKDTPDMDISAAGVVTAIANNNGVSNVLQDHVVMFHRTKTTTCCATGKLTDGQPYTVTTSGNNPTLGHFVGGSGAAAAFVHGAAGKAGGFFTRVQDLIYTSSKGKACGSIPGTANNAIKWYPSYWDDKSLHFTTVTATDVQDAAAAWAQGVYSICLCRQSNMKAGVACPNPQGGAAFLDKQGAYGQVAKLIVTDIKFVFGNGNDDWICENKRCGAVPKSIVRAAITFSAGVFDAADTFWFMDDRLSCQAGENGSVFGVLPRTLPTSGQVVDLVFNNLEVGRRYRLCVRNIDKNNNNLVSFKTLGTIAPLVSDLTVTPRAPVLFKVQAPKVGGQDHTFVVQVASSVSLQVGDVFLFTLSGTACPSSEQFIIPTAGNFYYNIDILRDKYSSAQQWYGSGSYSIGIVKSTTFTGTYRVCARKSTFNAVAGVYTHSVVDLATSETTIVPLRPIAVEPSSVENVATAKLRFRTPDQFEVADQFWFRRTDLACNLDTVNSAAAVVPDSTFNTASASSKFTLAKQATWQDKTLALTSLAVGQKYRLCVQLAVAPQKIIDLDTSVVEIRSARSPTPPPQTPTVRTNYNVVPTQSSAAVADKYQAFTFNSVSSATAGARTLTWKFPGTVSPEDRLALLPAGKYTCLGLTDPAVMVPATQATTSVSATSAEIPPMEAGKYTLCFCHSASSVAGCGHKSGYQQQVGFVTFFDADTNQTASVSLSDQSSGFQVTLGHAVGSQDRVMLISKDGVCGVSQPHAANAALSNVIPTAGTTGTANVLTFGAFSKSVAGTFAICYCRASTQQSSSCRGVATDPNYLPSFGGKIGTLVIEDVQLNGASFVTATTTSPSVTVKVTQTIFKFGQDKVWLAKGTQMCGVGTHSDSATLFAVQTLAESLTFNFGGYSRTPSSDLWSLCVQSAETGVITPLSSVGFFFTDVFMAGKYVSPVVGTSADQEIVLTHQASFSTANAKSYFYFRLASKPCFTTWPSSLPTVGTSTDRETSSFARVSNSGSTYKFKFTATQAKSVFRLCASVNAAVDNTVNTKFASAVDLGHIKVYTRPSIMAVATKAIVNTKSSSIKFTSVGSVLTDKDIVWFRRSDKACETEPPTTTADKFSLPSYAFVADATIDASGAEPSDTVFRACVKTEAGQILDWYDFQTAVVSIASDTSVCNRGRCPVKITYAGYLKAGDTAWFQSSSRQACLEGNGGATSSSQAQYPDFSATRNLGESAAAYLSFDFSNAKSGPGNPMRLCVKKGSDLLDFSTITLVVNSVVLTTQANSLTAETGVVQATAAASLNVTYSSSDFPSGTTVWFQPKTETCLKRDAGPSTSAAFSPVVATGARSWSVDFSKVTTGATGALTQWTACMEYQSKIYKLALLEISVFRFYVDQVSVKNEQVSLSVLPRALASGVPLFQGFYFRVTTEKCNPVPYAGSLADGNTTNRVYPSADVHQYDFSKAPLGSEYRLCAAGALNSVSDYSTVKVEVSCPDGKVGVGCTQCKTGNFASKTSPLTCTSCATPCNGNAVSCSPAANDTVKCQCSGDFDPASACLNCKAGFLKSGAVCVATKSPTATPSASPTSPTASPTAAPTAAPTPARACSQSDAAQYAGQCSGWVKQGFCTKDHVAFMAKNCAQSCCAAAGQDLSCRPSIEADAVKSCTDWAKAGYCSDEKYKNYMDKNCPSSCFSVSMGEYPDCHAWAAAGYCVTYSNWMASNNFCQTSCSKDSCTYAGKCPTWAQGGFCTNSDYNNFMSVNCPASCKA